jgi:hypothetical protein
MNDTDLISMRDPEPDVDPSPRPHWLGNASSDALLCVIGACLVLMVGAIFYGPELVQIMGRVMR